MARKRLKLSKIGSNSSLCPLAKNLAFQLYEKLFTKKRDTSKLLDLYKTMIIDKRLSEKSRIHYTFRYLSFMEERLGSRKSHQNFEKDFKRKDIHDSTVKLIKIERISLALALSIDKSEIKTLLRELSKAMNNTKDQYFLRRTSYIIAIQIFKKYEKIDQMNRVATEKACTLER